MVISQAFLKLVNKTELPCGHKHYTYVKQLLAELTTGSILNQIEIFQKTGSLTSLTFQKSV